MNLSHLLPSSVFISILPGSACQAPRTLHNWNYITKASTFYLEEFLLFNPGWKVDACGNHNKCIYLPDRVSGAISFSLPTPVVFYIWSTTLQYCGTQLTLPFLLKLELVLTLVLNAQNILNQTILKKSKMTEMQLALDFECTILKYLIRFMF